MFSKILQGPKKNWLVFGLACLILASNIVLAEGGSSTGLEADKSSSADRDYTTGEIISESMFGDVYSDPSKWQELSYGNFFTKGWDKPWQSPPTGGGGAPRQGWLNAYEGVFYRLSLGVFGWQHHEDNTDSYSGNLVTFTPINSRFEVKTEIPAASNSEETNFGDFRIQARFLLSESRDFTQTFNIEFRTPTGSPVNGNGVASVIPQYQFWANWWKGLVVRGGVGFDVPYAGDIHEAKARSTFDANFSVGYYMTPHDMTPFGDMVWYVATNYRHAIDNRTHTTSEVIGDETAVTSSANDYLSFSPGFRTHLGMDWYMLGTVELPVSTPKPFEYQVLFSFMKVY